MIDSKDITFRKMDQLDGEFVLEIRNDDSTRLFLNNSEKFSLQGFTIWYNIEHPYWLIAYHKDKPFGYVRTNYKDKEKGTIQIGMDIHPNHRGKKLSKPTYIKLFSFLKSEGYEKVWLEVLDYNTVAHGIYLSLGFKEIDRLKFGNRNSIVMERDI